MKLIIKIILLSFFVAAGFFIWSNFIRPSNEEQQQERLISFSADGQSFNIKIRRREKEILKRLGKKIKNFIYREAAEHNPPGDFLPDSIDNSVINKVKEKVD